MGQINTRDQIIAFVFNDPEKRLERFCKSLVSGQTTGDWEELQSIVLERLCSLPHHQVEDMWQRKEGYRSQALWIWMHTTAKTQAHGNRTQYQKVVLKPKEVFVEPEFFDIPTTTEDISERLTYENKIHHVKERFEQRAAEFTPLMRVVLESYMRGNMNASQICRTSGVPYNYYLTQLDEIRRVLEECAGFKPVQRQAKTTVIHFQRPSITRCRNLIRISQQYKKLQDVPYWRLLQGSFKARERKLYPQPTLFPINQYLPPLYRKMAIA